MSTKLDFNALLCNGEFVNYVNGWVLNVFTLFCLVWVFSKGHTNIASPAPWVELAVLAN